jgi:hypothetical protein
MPAKTNAFAELFFLPQRGAVASEIRDPLDCEDPEQLRKYADQARSLALATVDPATVESLNADAQDLEDLARSLEEKSVENPQADVVTSDDVEVGSDVDTLQRPECNPGLVG